VRVILPDDVGIELLLDNMLLEYVGHCDDLLRLRELVAVVADGGAIAESW